MIEGPEETLLSSLALRRFDPMRDTVEVGYWLLKDARGRGVATNSVRAAAEHAFANGIYRMEAHIRIGNGTPPNAWWSGSASNARASSGACCGTAAGASTPRCSACSHAIPKRLHR